MIKNSLGKMVEFDLEAAKSLKKRLEPHLGECAGLPMEFGELFLSVWGYGASIDEIESLLSELAKYQRKLLEERAQLIAVARDIGFDHTDRYFTDEDVIEPARKELKGEGFDIP